MTENRTFPMNCLQPTINTHFTLSSPQGRIKNKQVLCDKASQLNKVTVPIKQYSNKFLRNSFRKHGPQRPKKINAFQRFNIVFKKKYDSSKQPSEDIRFDEMFWQPAKQDCGQALFRVNSIQQSKKKQRLKTESPALGCNLNASIHEMESELLLETQMFSSLLAPSSLSFKPATAKSKFFREERRECQKKRNKSISLNSKPCDRISQSRGLQLFSKLYVKSKDEIVERHAKKTNRLVIKLDQGQSNFQARKITPIEKNTKARVLMQAFKPKKPKNRNCITIQKTQENFEPFQITAWDTTI